MAADKSNRRAVVATSVMIKSGIAGASPGALRSTMGFANISKGGAITTGVAAGTLALTMGVTTGGTNFAGTANAGTIGLLDLSKNRFRIPSAGRAIGGNTIGFGTLTANHNGSAGDIVTGFDSGSAYLGVNINGTFYVLQWPTNPTGAAGSVSVNPFAVGVA